MGIKCDAGGNSGGGSSAEQVGVQGDPVLPVEDNALPALPVPGGG